jgi:hypothetical protein
MRLFSFYPQASDVGETHSLVPGTVSGLVTATMCTMLGLNKIRTVMPQPDMAHSGNFLSVMRELHELVHPVFQNQLTVLYAFLCIQTVDAALIKITDGPTVQKVFVLIDVCKNTATKTHLCTKALIVYGISFLPL